MRPLVNRCNLSIKCPHCNAVAIANGTPASMSHKNNKNHVFANYFHCHNCGASLKAAVDVVIIRPPMTQEDMFAA